MAYEESILRLETAISTVESDIDALERENSDLEDQIRENDRAALLKWRLIEDYKNSIKKLKEIS